MPPTSSSLLSSASLPAIAAKRARRKQARPGELLDAALDLFVEKGFAATRVDAVAARAGVSKGTLFLYFPSKDELFKAVVRHSMSDRFVEWNNDFQAFQGTSREMLGYCMNSWWQRVGATKAAGLTKLVMGEAANFPELAAFYRQEVVEPGHSLIRRILQRGIDRGEFRPMDLDYAVYSVVAPMLFMILSRHSAGVCVSSDAELDPQRYIDMQLAILLDGLNPRPGQLFPDKTQICP